MAEPELKRIKILLMGQPNTGKTNLMLRYFKNGFDENYEPTQGTHMATRKFNYKKSQLDVEVLEIGGAALKNLIPQTLHGIVFTFDCSNRESFKGVEEWIEKAEQHLDVKGLVSVLASTKTDLEKEVGDEEAKNYAKSKKLTFFGTSAKTGNGIERLFLYVINQVVECSKDKLSVINKEYDLQKNSLVLKKPQTKDFATGKADGKKEKGSCC